MASFNKFESFIGQVGLGGHNLNTDTLKIMLTNTAPNATDDTKSDITEITAQNGYTAGGHAVPSSAYSESGGTGSLSGNDVVITASGGSFGPFRYAVLYNDTSATDLLIGWWDYGSSKTPADGESFTVDFGASILTLA